MILNEIFCRHRKQTFLRNIYGDEINRVGLAKIYRSWWVCNRCGAMILHHHLHQDGDSVHFELEDGGSDE